MCRRNSLRKQIEDGIVKCEFVILRPYTLCAIVAEIEGKRYRAVKHALCGKHDVWSEELGREIAYGRTLMEVARHAHMAD